MAERATEGDGFGAGVLSPTAGLTDDSFSEVVDVELKFKSWFGTGTGDSSLEVVDGTLVEPKSWAGTGVGGVVGFASEEESRPGSTLSLGGEAGSA